MHTGSKYSDETGASFMWLIPTSHKGLKQHVKAKEGRINHVFTLHTQLCNGARNLRFGLNFHLLQHFVYTISKYSDETGASFMWLIPTSHKGLKQHVKAKEGRINHVFTLHTQLCNGARNLRFGLNFHLLQHFVYTISKYSDETGASFMWLIPASHKGLKQHVKAKEGRINHVFTLHTQLCNGARNLRFGLNFHLLQHFVYTGSKYSDETGASFMWLIPTSHKGLKQHVKAKEGRINHVFTLHTQL